MRGYAHPMFSYRVSLQVRHPDRDPQDMATGTGLAPLRSWAAGDMRETPMGKPLPGTYAESYCVFELGDGDDGNLADFLRDALAKLEHAAEYIAEFRRTGGRLNFFITWSVGERGEIFDVELLARMVRLGIDLGIEPSARA